MGVMKEYDRRIRGGGDDAIAAVSELWESREKILFDITDAFTKARWIPVSERLPPEESVVVWDSENRIAVVAYRWVSDGQSNYTMNAGDGYGFCEYAVTHWMPLPEPPAA